MASASPFDNFAADYDNRFSDRLPASWLRTAVYTCVEPFVEGGSPVIELGCGTGEDAIWFAEQGCSVWASDASAAMLERARDKIEKLNVASRISLQQIDLIHWQPSDLPADFQARLVFSNFGALNCVRDLRPVFRTAWECLEDGGHLAVSLMGRFCLSESVFFGVRGQFAKASRRWNGESRYRAGGGDYPVWYHSPAALRSAAEGLNSGKGY